MSKQFFKYGRFEFKAALPEGEKLYSYIRLVPVISNNDGINLVYDKQWGSSVQGIFYPIKENGQDDIQNKETLLNILSSEFNFYSVIWNETSITWQTNGSHIHSINFADVFGADAHPYDKEYNLRITLGVGGKDFDNQEVTLPDVASWVTPSIRIDYIRI